MARPVGAVAGALVLGALLLAGCVPDPPSGPPPLTADELAAVRDAEARAWWEGMFPGREMPQVAVLEELPSEERLDRMTECLEEASIPGLTVLGPGEWRFDDASPTGPAGMAASETWWICAMQYPVRLDDTLMMSERQMDWLYDFYLERYRPCLASHGYELVGFPTREVFLRDSIAFPVWVPLDQWTKPVPSADEWAMLAVRCPVPDILDPYLTPPD